MMIIMDKYVDVFFRKKSHPRFNFISKKNKLVHTNQKLQMINHRNNFKKIFEYKISGSRD